MPEIKEAYCEACEEPMRLGVETDNDRWIVVCGCDEAQTLKGFLGGLDGFDSDEKSGSPRGMFQ